MGSTAAAQPAEPGVAHALAIQPRHEHTGSVEALSSLHAAMHAVQQHAAAAVSKKVHVRVKRLDKKTKAYIEGMLRRCQHRTWCAVHGKTLPPPKLHPAIARIIREWFELVDDDGSGTLEHHELLAALQTAQIPCDASSISEMIRLMDANRDGCIGWGEFVNFMKQEFVAGKHLLSGEYVLPSGMALPFGVMIRQLKRNQMLTDITAGGEARRKWLHFDVNIIADAKEVAEAEAAIALQKAFDETLHNRVTKEVVDEGQADGQDSTPGSGGLAATAAAGGASSQVQVQQLGFSGVRRPSWLAQGDKAVVVAGIPVQQTTPQQQTTTTTQQHPQAAADSGSSRSSSDEEPGNSSRGRLPTPRAWAKPDVVSRLPLGGLMSSTHAGVAHSNRQHRSDGDTAVAAASAGGLCLLGVEPGSVLASARSSYLAAGPMSSPTSLAQHLHANTPRGQQQEAQVISVSDTEAAAAGCRALQGSSGAGSRSRLQLDAAAMLSKLPASVQHLQLLGSPRLPSRDGTELPPALNVSAAASPRPGRPAKSAAAAPGMAEEAAAAAGCTGAALLVVTASVSGGPGSSTAADARSPTAALQCGGRCSSAVAAAGGSGSSSHHASAAGGAAPHHLLQPQPCREEWSTVAASCLSQQHSQQVADSSLPPASGRRRQQQQQQQAAKSSAESGRFGRLPGSCGGGGCGAITQPQPAGRVRRSSWSVSEDSGAAATAAVSAAVARGAQTCRNGGSSAVPGGSTGSAAAGAAIVRQPVSSAVAAMQGASCREVSVKHMLSARQLPPATLLSETYIGPVAAAMAAAHTPRCSDAAVGASLPDQQPWKQQPHSSAGSSASCNTSAAASGMHSGLDISVLLKTKLMVATNRGDAVVQQGQVLQYLAADGSSTAGTATALCSSGSRTVPAGVSPRCSTALHLQLQQIAQRLQQPAVRRNTVGGVPHTCSQQPRQRHNLGMRLPPADAETPAQAHGQPTQEKGLEMRAPNRSTNHWADWSGGASFRLINAGDCASSSAHAEGKLRASGSVSMQAGGSCSHSACGPTAAVSAAGDGSRRGSGSKGSAAAGRSNSSRQQHRLTAGVGGGEQGNGGSSSSGGSSEVATKASRRSAGKPVLSHHAASGPLGGRHPAFVSTWTPRAASTGSGSGAAAAGAGGHVAVLSLQGCRSTFSSATGGGGGSCCCTPRLMDEDGFLNIAAGGESAAACGSGCGSGKHSGGGDGSATRRSVAQSPRLAYSGISPQHR